MKWYKTGCWWFRIWLLLPQKSYNSLTGGGIVLIWHAAVNVPSILCVYIVYADYTYCVPTLLSTLLNIAVSCTSLCYTGDSSTITFWSTSLQSSCYFSPLCYPVLQRNALFTGPVSTLVCCTAANYHWHLRPPKWGKRCGIGLVADLTSAGRCMVAQLYNIWHCISRQWTFQMFRLMCKWLPDVCKAVQMIELFQIIWCLPLCYNWYADYHKLSPGIFNCDKTKQPLRFIWENNRYNLL